MKIIDAQVHIWSQTTVAPNGGHRQVSSFKATQSYLDQQIKMWTADRN